MGICIIGGAFDPPTVGHLNLARAILELTDMREVRLMPCYKSMFGKQMSSAEDRLNMVIRACYDFDNDHIKACSYEVKNKISGPTIDVLDDMVKCFNEELSFCIGTDHTSKITEWCDWKELISMFNFIIVSGRSGQKANIDAWEECAGDATYTLIIKPNYVPDISSTIVRKEIAEYGISNSVTQATMEYIKVRSLYVKN